MKALTIRQPWAQLVALGVKTIETRSWRTNYRGPLAIHAGARRPPNYEHHNVNDDTPPWIDLYCMSSCWEWWEHEDFHHGGLYRWRGPLGKIVATANLVDVVPIGGMFEEVGVAHDLGDLTGRRESLWFGGVDITGQLPYGDFTPGRYAWLLEDVKPTTGRCPACWGIPTPEGLEGDDCLTCNGLGTCAPVDAKGRQGLWGWTP